ncbi:hypothetical protein ACRAJ3_11420 [Rhodococcus pyridinivorans]|uniref:hypothetical protein n=1 Tax=Rhodococcus pyridinivorans TaxID=103816 RepID=UPI003D7F4CEE
MVSDPLARWWTQPVQVQRKAADGPYGPTFDPPATEVGKITAKRKKVLAPDGSEVISEARVSLPFVTAQIPPGSLVTLPDEFGGRTAEVLADQRHWGTELTPNFYSIDLT